MRLDGAFVLSCTEKVLNKVPITLALTFVPLLAGFLPALLIAVVRKNRIPVLDPLFGILNSFFRSVPLIVLLFLSYYGIPKLINGLFYGGIREVSFTDLNPNTTALITLSIYAASLQSEMIRGALNSVAEGQEEAARALGLGRRTAFLRVILPQAVPAAIPNYVNFILALLKNTSVVFAISVIDMMAAAKLEAERGYRYIEAYLVVSVFYILLSFLFSAGARKLRKGMLKT